MTRSRKVVINSTGCMVVPTCQWSSQLLARYSWYRSLVLSALIEVLRNLTCDWFSYTSKLKITFTICLILFWESFIKILIAGSHFAAGIQCIAISMLIWNSLIHWKVEYLAVLLNVILFIIFICSTWWYLLFQEPTINDDFRFGSSYCWLKWIISLEGFSLIGSCTFDRNLWALLLLH